MGLNFADQYSFIHFCSGAIAQYLGLSFWEWFIIHMIFEILENTKPAVKLIQDHLWWWPGGKLYPDSLLNSTGDQFFAMLGWLVAYQLNEWGDRYDWHGYRDRMLEYEKIGYNRYGSFIAEIRKLFK